MSGFSVCCDFDGTVCIPDSCDFLLAKFAPPEWKELDGAVWRGELTERDAFQKQIALLRVSWQEARAALLNGVRIREGFSDFVSFCRAHNLPLTILSSGLRQLIDVLLQSVGVSGIPVLAHQAEISGDRWLLKLIDLPRLAEHCSHCKCVTVLARKQEGKVIYIGDGYTDLCPVQHADVVFATGRLAEECKGRGLPHISFRTFHEIERELKKLIESEQDHRR